MMRFITSLIAVLLLSNSVFPLSGVVVKALDGGELHILRSTSDGFLSVSDQSDGLAIVEGNVNGKSVVHKFGYAPDFDFSDEEVDVWDGANDAGIDQMTIEESPTANIDSLISNNVADTQTIEISGLDENWLVVTQNVTLNGQTRVAIGTPLLFVYRMKNVSSTDIQGDIYAYTNNSATTAGVPDDSSTVRASIHDGNNQTEMAYYPVPAGKVAYLRSIEFSQAGASKTTNYIFKLRVKPFGGVFQLKDRASGTFTSPYLRTYIEPIKYDEKSIIKVTCQLSATGTTGAGVAADFDLVLEDK